MMMNQPSLDVLLEKVENKYTLVVATAKCTRLLMEQSLPDGYPEEQKPVSMALWKIADTDMAFECARDGYK
jgi:DNA-directed RNA polymerase subunit omega